MIGEESSNGNGIHSRDWMKKRTVQEEMAQFMLQGGEQLVGLL